MLFEFCQRSLNVISNPTIPLEEWFTTFLALFKDLVGILLHLNELGLLLVSHDLGKEGHDEKLVVGILAATFLTIAIQTLPRFLAVRSTTKLTAVFATVCSVEGIGVLLMRSLWLLIWTAESHVVIFVV